MTSEQKTVKRLLFGSAAVASAFSVCLFTCDVVDFSERMIVRDAAVRMH
jgi:hypothetical protein